MATSFDGEFTLTKADHSSDANGDSIQPDDSVDPLDPTRWKHMNKIQPAISRPIVKSTFTNSVDKGCQDDEIGLICRGKMLTTESSDSSKWKYDEIGLVCEKDFSKFLGGKRRDKSKKVSRGNALKPVLLNKVQPPCKQLYDWAVIPGHNQIQIEGHVRGENSSFQLCRTSRVMSVSSSGTKICTSSGSTYELNGDMNLSASIRAGIPIDIAQKFLKGFPKDWKNNLKQEHLFQSWSKEVSVSSKSSQSQLFDKYQKAANNKGSTTDETSSVEQNDPATIIDEPHTGSTIPDLLPSPSPDKLKRKDKMIKASHIDSAIKRHPKQSDIGHVARSEGKIKQRVTRAKKSKQTATTTSKDSKTTPVVGGNKHEISKRKRRKSMLYTPTLRAKIDEYVPVKQTRSGRNVVIPRKLDQSFANPISNMASLSCKAPVKRKSKREKKNDELKSAKRLCTVVSNEKLNDSTPHNLRSSKQIKSPKSSQKPQKRTRNKSSKAKLKDVRKETSATRSKSSNLDEQAMSHLALTQKCEVVLLPLRRSLCSTYSSRQTQTATNTNKGLKKKVSSQVPASNKSTWSAYKKGQLRKLVNADMSWSDISTRLKAPSEECMEVYNNMKTKKRTKAKTDKDKDAGQAAIAKIPRKGTLKHRKQMRQYLDDVMKKPDLQKQDIFHGEPEDSSTRNFFNDMCNKENFVPVTPNCKAPWLEESCTTPAWFKTPTGQADWASALDSETPAASKQTWYQRVNSGDDEAKRKEADKVILQLGKKMAKAALPLPGEGKNQEQTKKNINKEGNEGISLDLRTIAESAKSADAAHEDSDVDDYFQLDSE